MAAEKPAPTRKKIDRPIRTEVSSAGSTNSSANASAAKTASVLNCRLR